MTILLVGEYSRLHNSLKEGLQALGHTVHLVAMTDYFKKYPSDYTIYNPVFQENSLGRWCYKGVKKLTGINLQKIERAYQFYRFIHQSKSYDWVQLINSDALELYPSHSRWLYKKLFAKARYTSLVVCGDEPPVVQYWLTNTQRYSILTPLFENPSLKSQYLYSLKYTQKNYRKTFEWLQKHCTQIIASDIDYHLALQATNIPHKFIPNPINVDQIPYESPETHNPEIFLGVNTLSQLKKGTSFFKQALTILSQKYPNLPLTIAENLPYNQYMQGYQKATILLDQIYAFDQGYNALEAMARGKIVFTGAETEFLQHYNLQKNQVAINALPDVNDLVSQLTTLIQNPQTLQHISQNARQFVKTHHHYITIAQQYFPTQ